MSNIRTKDVPGVIGLAFVAIGGTVFSYLEYKKINTNNIYGIFKKAYFTTLGSGCVLSLGSLALCCIGKIK